MEKVMQDFQFDKQMVLQSMRDECLIPADVNIEIDEREKFYANFQHVQLAKSATFGRQDDVLSLMTATGLRRDVLGLRDFVWVVILLLGYIAYKVS